VDLLKCGHYIALSDESSKIFNVLVGDIFKGRHDIGALLAVLATIRPSVIAKVLEFESRVLSGRSHGCFSVEVLASNTFDDVLGGRERTDHDVIPVRISECELHSSSVRIHVGLLLESSDERACPWQRQVEIIDPEKQEEAVARLRLIGARQGGMLMGTPLVKAEQDRSVRVEDLTEVVMGGSRLRQAK
jgi:hypothetical protein